MLSLETETKLAQLLYILSQGEKKVEIARQNLCQNREFEPYSAFKLLDQAGLGTLSLIDILNFLKRYRLFCTEQECQLLIREYDANTDGRLSLNEFTQFSLPTTNQFLRDLTQARPASNRISSDAEYLMMKLFEAEIQMQRDMKNSREILVSCYDFNLIDAYQIIDFRRISGITRTDMFSFLRRRGFVIGDEDIDAIYRRIDNDGDGIISYSEFVDGVLATEPDRSSIRSSYEYAEGARSISPLRSSPLTASLPRDSPLRITESPSKSFYQPRASSPLRKSSPIRNEISYQSPKRSSPLRNSSPSRIAFNYQSNSPRRSSPLRRSSPSRTELTTSSVQNSSPSKASFYKSSDKYSSPSKSFTNSNSPVKQQNGSRLGIFEEKELVNMLLEQIRLYRELEKLKVELSLKPDFNLIDAFRMFDMNDRNSITTLDIENAMQEISPMDLHDEVYLLIRHYSSFQDGQLRFSDFSEMFTPKKDDYARLLKNREPYSVAHAHRRRVFSRETTGLFIDALKLHLEAETVAESLRQRLSRRTEFNAHDAFQAIDRDRDGYITIEEFGGILETNNIFVNSNDLEALMQRYDRNKDGRVSYSEFAQEVTPKSPRKY